MYLIIRKGCVIFGSGATKEEAVEDLKEWIDSDDEKQNWSASDFETCYSSASIGEFVLLQSTDILYQDVQKRGGDTLFVVHNNMAQTWNELDSDNQ